MAVALSVAHAQATASLENCNKTSVDFIVLEGDATSKVRQKCAALPFFVLREDSVFELLFRLFLRVRVRVGVLGSAHAGSSGMGRARTPHS
jgi:hypothetical protein